MTINPGVPAAIFAEASFTAFCTARANSYGDLPALSNNCPDCSLMDLYHFFILSYTKSSKTLRTRSNSSVNPLILISATRAWVTLSRAAATSSKLLSSVRRLSRYEPYRALISSLALVHSSVPFLAFFSFEKTLLTAIASLFAFATIFSCSFCHAFANETSFRRASTK